VSKVHGVAELGWTDVRVCDSRWYSYGRVRVKILNHIVFECSPLQVSDHMGL